MTICLAFDVYGTLIDTRGVERHLQRLVGDDAVALSRLWRDKQLEYSFRRGLMRRFADFAVCTANALDYACAARGIRLTEGERQELLDAYRSLPAFDDVATSLEAVASVDCQIHALSNGSARAVDGLLEQAGIRGYFRSIVSVEAVRTFKPDPTVYEHFVREACSGGEDAWLVSGNPFDVIGAVSAGLFGIWLARSEEAIFDPWDIEPTVTVRSLTALLPSIENYYSIRNR